MYFLEAPDGSRHGPYEYVDGREGVFELRTELGSLRALRGGRARST